MPVTLNLVSYSGGKDSGALALHLLEQDTPNLRLVFCDTKWEHPETYEYAHEFARRTGIPLVIVDSMGMEALILKKKRAPSAKARFCTEELKIKPFAAYVAQLQAEGFDTIVWVGERAEESPGRARKPCDEWSSTYNSFLVRGIRLWTIAQVLAIHAKFGIPMNPLYKKGMGRVGCAPCLPFASKAELRETAIRFPEVYDVKLADLEAKVGRTLFSPGRTPPRFCSNRVWREAEPGTVADDGEEVPGRPAGWVYLATVADVKRWALSRDVRKPGQMDLFPEPASACRSLYALCE